MISGMLKVDEAIYESNKIICRQISRLGESTRGEVSQEVLESLRHFVEHIILKEYANGGDIEDTHENLKAAVKYVKNEPQLIHLSRFHHFLQVSSSHDNFDDVESLVATYNQRLYHSEKQQLRKMVIKYNHLFIEHYKEDTVSIIRTIKNLTQNGIDNYTNMANYWMQTTNQVNSDEKKAALLNMFSHSKVALIYGSAGTGKSYLINHISNMFASKSRLYLAQTNPAVNNMRRKVTASANSTFMTISKFTSNKYKGKTTFDIQPPNERSPNDFCSGSVFMTT